MSLGEWVFAGRGRQSATSRCVPVTTVSRETFRRHVIIGWMPRRTAVYFTYEAILDDPRVYFSIQYDITFLGTKFDLISINSEVRISDLLTFISIFIAFSSLALTNDIAEKI